MERNRRIKVSKYLSKHLRHQPQKLGLQLETGGWIDVDVLLQACAQNQFPISRTELTEVVNQNDKQRFAFNDSRNKIRANQGHSIDIDLQLEPQNPPDLLFHGTGEKSVAIILDQGLKKMRRHHVHLSDNMETAHRVGSRHGRPAIFIIDAAAMVAAGFTFYCSANGVWLADRIPPKYLRLMQPQ